MFKNIISILVLILIISCGSSKPVVYAPKPKPIVKKVIAIPKKVEPIVVESKPKVEIKSSNDSQVLEATSKVKVTNDMVLAYIAKYKEIAKNSMQQFGVPASITLSQALLESGSGTGSLCLQANNHFGIKCRKDWTGPSVKYDDDAEQECFRKYNDPNDSFKDHSQFLLSKPWYAKLFRLDVKDYKSWAKGLKVAGYATDPQYPQKLINLIEKYKLYEIDDEVKPSSIIINEIKLDSLPKSDDIIVENTVVDQQNLYSVQPKDTLYSISKKFNLAIEELKTLNNLTENALSIGQIIKIKK
jgi:flagellum-specific peptidoglycan hydrolase FlgJ